MCYTNGIHSEKEKETIRNLEMAVWHYGMEGSKY